MASRSAVVVVVWMLGLSVGWAQSTSPDRLRAQIQYELQRARGLALESFPENDPIVLSLSHKTLSHLVGRCLEGKTGEGQVRRGERNHAYRWEVQSAQVAPEEERLQVQVEYLLEVEGWCRSSGKSTAAFEAGLESIKLRPMFMACRGQHSFRIQTRLQFDRLHAPVKLPATIRMTGAVMWHLAGRRLAVVGSLKSHVSGSGLVIRVTNISARVSQP